MSESVKKKECEIRRKTVLITGAARGIGAETARQVAAKGGRVALVGLEPDRLEQLAGELGPDAIWCEADVTSDEQLKKAVTETVARFGGIDVAVANAGIARFGAMATIAPHDFEQTIAVNLLGVWRTLRAVLPYVAEQRGYVIPVASSAVSWHLPLMSHYAASKAGVEAMANALRMELRAERVGVGVAYFGLIDTDMVRRADEDPGGAVLMRSMVPRFGGKPLPPSRAAAAIVNAIERRARRAFAPRWMAISVVAAPLVQRAIEWRFRTHGEEAMRAITRIPGPDGESERSRR